MEGYHLRAVQRNFKLGRDIEQERGMERAKSESLDRDLLRQRFASLESKRLRIRLLSLELEPEYGSESEKEEALFDLESESELDDLYEARCHHFACSSRIYTGCAHLDCFLPLSFSPFANLSIPFLAATSRKRSLCL